MEETYLLNHPGVKKKILHGGQGPMPHFPPGTKLAFHFQTLKDDFERTVIDDSRKNKRPTEIFVGKMFKMEVWEVLLTSMRIGEVAEFWCDAIHTGLYPMVSKGMRLAAQGKDPLEGQQHTCGMGNLFHYHSMGSPELDELMKEPQPLIFIMELIEVGEPFSYKRDSWMMDKDEKLKAVPPLHLQGNMLVKQGRFHEASSCYQEAVLLLRTVQSREMPGDEDYINLGKLIIPLVLNYCQCMLEIEEYYEVIEHTTELLDKHKDCVKAYYKRAKAYAAVWDEKEARKNFLMVAKLDVTLSALVHRELRQLSERMKEKYWEDKEKYWNILEQKQESDKGQAEERENRETEDSSPRPADEEKNEERKENTDEAKGQEVPPFGEGPQAAANQRAAAVTEGKDWQQMLRLIMLLQDEGNFYVKEQRHSEAIEKFKEALQYVDHLQNKEVQYKGEDWESLEKVKLPLILNLSQCKMELGEYQEVVHLNSKVLKKHKRNVKAVYQRARAHAALCHEDEARRDFDTLTRLDPKFKPIVKQELKKLGEKVRTKLVHENKNYWTGSEEKWAKMAQAAKKDKQRKKEVKWADEGGEPVAAEPKPAGRQQTEEEEGEEGKRNVLDKKEESPPTGHQKERQEGEKNNTNEEGERMQDQMEVRSGTTEREEVKERDLAEGGGVQQSAKRTQRTKAKSKAKEVPPTAAPEQTDKNTATEQANEKAGRPSILAESTNQGKEAEARAVVRDGMEEKRHRTTDAKAEEHKVHIPQDTEECVSGGKAQQPGPKTNAEASSATPDKSAKNPKRKNRKRK